MLLCISAVATTAAPHGYVPTSQPETFDLRRVPVAAQGLMQLRANAFVVAFAQNIGCSLAQHAGRLGRVCARFSKVPSSLGRCVTGACCAGRPLNCRAAAVPKCK